VRVRVSFKLPGLLDSELASSGGGDAYVPMVGKGRKWAQSTRLFNLRRPLTLRDPQLEASDLSGALSEGSPSAAAFLDGQPGISGRIREACRLGLTGRPAADSPCHTRLGLGLDSGLISPR
jgi:hypothetical protein